MSIRVTCRSCGSALQARDELAGKRVKCPACGQALAIPAPQAAAVAPPPDEPDLDGLLGAEAGAVATPPAPRAQFKTGSQGPNTRLIVGLSVSAGAALLVLLLAFALWPSGHDKPLAEAGTTPGNGSPSDAGEGRAAATEGPRDTQRPPTAGRISFHL